MSNLNNFYILNFITAMILSLVLGPIIIPELKKLKIGQTIRLDGPESHLVKSGTPIMGGIIFIIATVVTMIVFGVKSKNVLICITSMIGFGAIGLIDDYLIVVKKTNEGITPRQKFSAQVLVSILIIFLATQDSSLINLYIPFFGDNKVNLGLLFYPLTLFVVLGTVNSVNLTDGLDGLASTVSVIALTGFGVMNVFKFNREVAMFSMTLAGALVGFLKFNRYPAQTFMGDVGSLAIGGAFAAIAITSGTTLYLPFVGIIFVIETLSVIIQVVSFKATGKRAFLMAPIHHHFEAKGIHETKIVKIFALITLVFTIISILGIR
ncbi:MAG: phospho-N-acetylmuramoyl-pentapeptide-transferase [Tissierellia bacterium]|nr:phospho-N-acetylmuramoyl-pentapeptide-transferase [Tissierellia bacterium]